MREFLPKGTKINLMLGAVRHRCSNDWRRKAALLLNGEVSHGRCRHRIDSPRTGLAKSWRGSLNMTHPVTFTGHVLRHAIERGAASTPAEVDDVIVGGKRSCGREPAGNECGFRQVALRAGCPVTTGGLTVNRFCSTGLQTTSPFAAQRAMTGEGEIFCGGWPRVDFPARKMTPICACSSEQRLCVRAQAGGLALEQKAANCRDRGQALARSPARLRTSMERKVNPRWRPPPRRRASSRTRSFPSLTIMAVADKATGHHRHSTKILLAADEGNSGRYDPMRSGWRRFAPRCRVA